MLRKPVPTGVVMGALRRASLVRRTLSITARAAACRRSILDARLLHVPLIFTPVASTHAWPPRQFGAGAVASNQRHVVSHVGARKKFRQGGCSGGLFRGFCKSVRLSHARESVNAAFRVHIRASHETTGRSEAEPF